MSKRSSRQAALDRLHARIRHCDRCPLHRTRTNAVPGAGPATARIVFVGEAPGRQEDLRGEPFVGRAGQVFDQLLASSGLSRHDVYITNIVKSRPFVGGPPGRNRNPSREEIAACTPWLQEQLAIIRPPLVVTLGGIALKQVSPSAKLAKVHGRIVAHDAFAIVPLYHPAMARYGREWTTLLRRDFARLRRLLAKGSPAKPAKTK
ncbi:MAG: uracil-DNA glycosylase [bacterium]